MRTSLLALLCLTVAAGAEAAEGPLSAIDWLSDSIATPVAALPEARDDLPESAVTPEVTTLPLGAQLPDGVGLVSAAEAGLPRDLWGASTSAELAALLAGEPLDLIPAARGLMKRVVLAELDPPADADQRGSLLIARIDKLLGLGALEEAASILDITGTATPELFKRRFDVALLTGDEASACDELRSDPAISPTYPARIFCLARSGDWHTAAVTLDTANALGLLDPDEDELLARFLHPELAEDAPPLRPPSRPSPLVFRLFEAIGEPLPTGTLPVAFAHADLRPTNGWKAQLDAAERLARTAALDPNRLLGLYTNGRPSASGGVWDRATAIRELERALSSGDPDEVSAALLTAWRLMSDAGLEISFAETFAPRLGNRTLSPSASALAFRMALLTPEFQRVASVQTVSGRGDNAFLAAVARGTPAEMPPPNALGLAIRQGFEAGAPPPRFETLVADDRRGEAVLRALSLLTISSAGNYDDIRDAIALLRALGFEVTARRAALELLILGDPA